MWQASWHLPMVHTRGCWQSLLRMHTLPTANLTPLSGASCGSWPLVLSSAGSAHTPLTHSCFSAQSPADRQPARQRRSDAHTRMPPQVLCEQLASPGNWQTVP